MIDRLLLDTHIALWLEAGDSRLAQPARQLMEECWKGGGTLYLSAVSAWEIAMLAAAGHVTLDMPAAEWVDCFLDRPGIEAVALGYRAACRAYQLDQFEHKDPADRMLIATAIELGCPMVTYDDRITRFARRHGRGHGFSINIRP